MPWQFLNLSFWQWALMTPADHTREWFRQWNRMSGDTHKKDD
jgi:hypothetical protein